jgi:hypothetical protein
MAVVVKGTVFRFIAPCPSEQPHISEECIISILEVEEHAKKETNRSRRKACRLLLLVSFLAYSSALKVRQYFLPKCWARSELQGVTTIFFNKFWHHSKCELHDLGAVALFGSFNTLPVATVTSERG